jgi:hypothetical protein
MNIFCKKCGYEDEQFVLVTSKPKPYKVLCEYRGYFHVLDKQPFRPDFRTVVDCRCPQCNALQARYIGNFEPNQVEKDKLYQRLVASYYRNKRAIKSKNTPKAGL